MSALHTVLDSKEEAALLKYWSRTFQRVYGQPVDVADRSAGGCTMTFPNVVDPIELLGGVGHFAHQPAMVEHVRSLGFDWGEDRRIFTTPSPTTFNSAVDEALGEDVGWRLAFVVEDSPVMAMGPFLDSYLRGTIPIHTASRWFYWRRTRTPWGRRSLRFSLASVAHDLSVHALNYHLVPGSFIEEIRATFADGLPDQVATWPKPGASAPLTVGYFLDNDLNRYCYAVWCRSSRPSEFVEIFQANADQLRRVQEVRIEETLAGKGDVPSGETKDMEELEHTEFVIR